MLHYRGFSIVHKSCRGEFYPPVYFNYLRYVDVRKKKSSRKESHAMNLYPYHARALYHPQHHDRENNSLSPPGMPVENSRTSNQRNLTHHALKPIIYSTHPPKMPVISRIVDVPDRRAYRLKDSSIKQSINQAIADTHTHTNTTTATTTPVLLITTLTWNIPP